MGKSSERQLTESSQSGRGPMLADDIDPVDEERKGLLSGEASESQEDLVKEHGWSRRKLISVASGLILLLLGAVLTPPLVLSSKPYANQSFNGEVLRSNGTHDFKRTVLIMSIDGLRADYLDRGFTPHLLDISKQGLRAKSMKPVFPTLTFPNHWALMTGLHAESHGIVGNNFWDPISGDTFRYWDITSAWISEWWLGEPMWETAGKAGLITANLMWPGPPTTTSGAKPTYFVPWQNKVPLQDKLDKIMSWIDLPLDERPQLITTYEPSLDQAGHLMGPMSQLVNDTLGYVDTFASQLHTALVARNLSDIVDIVFVSDHGMMDTAHRELVYLDDIIGEGWEKIEHDDGWPNVGIRFAAGTNTSHYVSLLREASFKSDPPKFDVYTKEDMPERYHFANNERIAPVWAVPRMGYILTSHAEGDVGVQKGMHGYSNDNTEMHAMFVAHGPFSSVVKTLHKASASSLFGKLKLLPNKNKGWHSTADDTYVMDTFRNVQVYGLVMKLLGIEEHSAPHNGTKGFWDRYF